ncbi:twitching motility protein PilT, partial [Leptospira sp. SA-E8]
MDITQLLTFGVRNQASDLHLSTGLPPMLRVHGDMQRIPEAPLRHEDVQTMLHAVMSEEHRRCHAQSL